MQVDVNALGDLIADLIADAVGPLEKSNAELREKLAALEAREPQKGDPGKDADPVDVDAIVEAAAEAAVSALLGSDRMDTLADLKAAEAVAKHFEANPVRDGKDADPVTRDDIAKEVAAYLRDNPPEAGKSVTLEEVSIFLEAAVAKHVLELERRATDTIQRAVDKIPTPQDGKDGADFTDFAMDFDGERTVTIKGKGAEIVKRLPIPLDKGYWREGMACEKADIVTHDGTAWIALRDTKAKPALESKEDWRLFARKGRDGKDGRNGIDKTAAVKVGSNA